MVRRLVRALARRRTSCRHGPCHPDNCVHWGNAMPNTRAASCCTKRVPPHTNHYLNNTHCTFDTSSSWNAPHRIAPSNLLCREAPRGPRGRNSLPRQQWFRLSPKRSRPSISTHQRRDLGWLPWSRQAVVITAANFIICCLVISLLFLIIQSLINISLNTAKIDNFTSYF